LGSRRSSILQEVDVEMLGTNEAAAGPGRTGATAPGAGTLPDTAWRTRDIVVAAVIGVAFGVVFWVWGFAWSAVAPLDNVFPVLRDSLYAVWLIPAVLAPLIIRKPGAALFAEMVAAAVSALLGSQWGVDALLSGFVQGAAAELVFAFTLYRNWTPVVIAIAAVASAAAAWAHDWALYYSDVSLDLQIARGILMAVSALVFVAAGSILLERALRQSGVLEGFPA
jgi:energy-coupling factor transport system substrate-specific component